MLCENAVKASSVYLANFLVLYGEDNLICGRSQRQAGKQGLAAYQGHKLRDVRRQVDKIMKMVIASRDKSFLPQAAQSTLPAIALFILQQRQLSAELDVVKTDIASKHFAQN